MSSSNNGTEKCVSLPGLLVTFRDRPRPELETKLARHGFFVSPKIRLGGTSGTDIAGSAAVKFGYGF